MKVIFFLLCLPYLIGIIIAIVMFIKNKKNKINNRYCTKCGYKFKKDEYLCSNCSKEVINNTKVSIPYKKPLIVISIFLLSCIILTILTEKIKEVRDKNKSINEVNKYLKKNYSNIILDVEFQKKESCQERRWGFVNINIAQSSSDEVPIKDCKIYFYDIILKGNMKSKAYFIDNDGSKFTFDEIKYTFVINNLLKYKNDLYFKSIDSFYYKTEDSANYTFDLDNLREIMYDKKVIIYIDKNIYDFMNRDYLNRFLKIEKDINNYSDLYVNIVAVVNDKYIMYYNKKKNEFIIEYTSKQRIKNVVIKLNEYITDDEIIKLIKDKLQD